MGDPDPDPHLLGSVARLLGYPTPPGVGLPPSYPCPRLALLALHCGHWVCSKTTPFGTQASSVSAERFDTSIRLCEFCHSPGHGPFAGVCLHLDRGAAPRPPARCSG